MREIEIMNVKVRKEKVKKERKRIDRRPDTMDCHGVEGVGRKHVHSSFVPLNYHI
jgi:hypothetical protein